jgi:HD superfamily phosphodiesterase
MLENDFFKGVENFVFNLFKNELPPQVVYHNFEHTNQVVKHTFEIGTAEGVSDEDIEILLLAAWFHDIGFVHGYEKHEEKSKEIAENYLYKLGYNSHKIEKVTTLICVTKMPQKPTNKLEEIICDADLYHLGTESFVEKSNLLRSEWEMLCNKHLTDIEFLTTNETFLKSHKYFTNYAFSKLTAQKTLNWLKIEKDLKKAKLKDEELAVKS